MVLLVGNPNEHRTVSDQFRRSNSLEHRLQSRVRMTVGAEILLGPGKSGRGSFRCALTRFKVGLAIVATSPLKRYASV